MPATISTSIAVQSGATTQLLITGIGTNFSGSPIAVSAGSILSQNAIDTGTIQIQYSATGFVGPTYSVVFTDTGSGATCTVLIRALPILERIRQDLISAIKMIDAGNPGMNYFTMPSVQELAAANGDADNVIVVALGESQPLKPPQGKVRWKQTFYALCYVLPVDTEVGAAAAVDPRLVYLFSDVFTAVNQERYRGGLAYDSVVGAPQFESDASESQFRVSVPIHVQYDTLENDPTSQG